MVIKFVRDNNKYTKIYEESYKKEIIEADYKAAEFDNKVFNIFSSDDYLEGTLENDIFVKMCDLNIQNQTRTRTKTHVEDIFQGIFVYTKSKKDIGTYVEILRNKRKIVELKEKIKMDSCEFEKYFDVYSDNNIITMQILTSDIMELLVEFYNKYQLDYEVVIKNNTIYMRFFTGPMFEPEIFVNSMDKQLLHVYFGTFQFIVEFSKKINEILQELEV